MSSIYTHKNQRPYMNGLSKNLPRDQKQSL